VNAAICATCGELPQAVRDSVHKWNNCGQLQSNRDELSQGGVIRDPRVGVKDLRQQTAI
jgi:hypothetical protein